MDNQATVGVDTQYVGVGGGKGVAVVLEAAHLLWRLVGFVGYPDLQPPPPVATDLQRERWGAPGSTEICQSRRRTKNRLRQKLGLRGARPHATRPSRHLHRLHN